MQRLFVFSWIAASVLGASHCFAEDRPTTGREIPRYAAFDDVVNKHMDLIGAPAASLAIAYDGKIVYARGFGWSDRAKKMPTQPDSLFRIASCTKPITAAIVRNLIRGGRLNESMPVFGYLGIASYNGEVGDDRLANITIKHLLEHKGGWDKDQSFDPMYRLSRIEKEMRLSEPMNTVNVIEYMLSQPLESAPGEKRIYSNFGYLVLGRVIEKATGSRYADAVQGMICGPLGIADMSISLKNPAKRDPREVYYPKESGLDLELRDSLGGLCTSAPSMCVFLDRYWINGERRNPRNKRSYYHRGSQPNSTTCLMEQRSDGIHYVVMFNSRRNGPHTEDAIALRVAINRTIDEIKSQ